MKSNKDAKKLEEIQKAQTEYLKNVWLNMLLSVNKK